MATILKGAPVVAAMNERNAALCEQLKAKGITPTLAVVRVGEREDDLSYERGVIARCGKVGVEVKQFLAAVGLSPSRSDYKSVEHKKSSSGATWIFCMEPNCFGVTRGEQPLVRASRASKVAETLPR